VLLHLKVDHGSASDVCLLCFCFAFLLCLMIAPCSLLILVCRCCCAASSKTCHLDKRICQLLEQQWRQFLHILHLPHVYIKACLLTHHHSRGLGCQQIANLLVMMMMHHHVQERWAISHTLPFFPSCVSCVFNPPPQLLMET